MELDRLFDRCEREFGRIGRPFICGRSQMFFFFNFSAYSTEGVPHFDELDWMVTATRETNHELFIVLNE